MFPDAEKEYSEFVAESGIEYGKKPVRKYLFCSGVHGISVSGAGIRMQGAETSSGYLS